MKIFITCLECLQSTHKTNQDELKMIQSIPAQIDDNLCATAFCPNGHKIKVCIQEQDFELRFQSGVIAIIEGFYSEAIYNFSSGLEQFFKFSIEVIFESLKNSSLSFEDVFKKLKLSERTLGAFNIMYAVVFKKTPDFRLNSHKKIRNDVLHNGRFISELETKKFCEETLSFVFDTIDQLKQNCSSSLEFIINENFQKRAKKAKENGVRLTTYGHPANIIGMSSNSIRGKRKSLDEAIDIIKNSHFYGKNLFR